MVTNCPLFRVVLALRLKGLFLMAKEALYLVDLIGVLIIPDT